MSKLLLINPNYYDDIFLKSKAKAAISRGTMPLGLACIAAPLLAGSHAVKILNLNLADKPDNVLISETKEFKPDIVGITSTTPLIYTAYKIASLVKQISSKTVIIAGGPHPSALPEEVLNESLIDCVVKGEGDYVLKMIADNGPYSTIPNMYAKVDNRIVRPVKQQDPIMDIDALPFPAYELLNIRQYNQPRISSRRFPLGYIETSRGCYGRCIFCNKNIHGHKMRMKSPDRVVAEMERMLKIGFKELHIIDDLFTADMKRAYEICEILLRKGLRFPWYPRGGIRVDRVDLPLLKMMKKAGCYRIPFGIESGSPRILDVINKKITLDQAEKAVHSAKSAGLETECYFMIGHPTETEDDIMKSIDFAIKLNPDYAKFAIAIPLPGTQMFDQMSQRGQIKTKEWNKYNFSSSPRNLYEHDTLSWQKIENYYDICHKSFYFRPSYITKMFIQTVIKGTIYAHVKAFFKTRW